jgi:CRP-like cAMP-binding protein
VGTVRGRNGSPSCRVARVSIAPDRLRALPLLASLSDAELERLGRAFEDKHVSAGAHLTLEGASGYSFFVIESGTVRVERDGQLLKTLSDGDFFGEAAILTGERRNATVTAASDVDLLVLFGTEFRVLESELPETAERIRAKMLERVNEPLPDTT